MTMNIAMLGTGRIADQHLAPAITEVEEARDRFLWAPTLTTSIGW